VVEDQIGPVFAAMADPTRRAILERLAGGGEATVGELAEPFEMSLAAVSKHVQVLSRAGLVSQRREGRQRHCRLEPEPLRAADAFLARYRPFWEARLDALAALFEDR
jgi:DNA-binding transcriptional ArsR family regulator